MLLPADIEKKLGFDRIRERLISYCDSPQGKEQASLVKFSADAGEVSGWLAQTAEMKAVLESGDPLPPLVFTDLRETLKGAATQGHFLDSEAFLELLQSIGTSVSLLRFFSSRKEEYPRLRELLSMISDHTALGKEISRVIDDDGEVRTSASPELRRIRTELDRARLKLRKDLERIFRDAQRDGMVPDKTSITVREGRMVIPVLAEYKRRLKGFIHDESATGQTVYLEPAEVLESNNLIRELEYAERREIIRILTTLTSSVRPHLSTLLDMSGRLGEVDMIRARARISRDLSATMPRFSEMPEVKLVEARHPLLYLNYRASGRLVVPLSLELDDVDRIIVISGPNAGGKSVALKTVGLLQYMWQSGFLVPAGESSTLGIFSDIFIDIGDEQSIENDLSTYSSHLTLMKAFLGQARRESLILIDEFGTGTDPQYGGAIAEAILDHFRGAQCRGLITTHYGNIKTYAEHHEGVLNAAMKYDVSRLEPLYELQLGIPGSSFSFEVARKIGLQDAIISYARDLVGQKQANVDELILKLEKQEQDIRERDLKLKQRESEAERLEKKYRKLSDEIEGEKKQILSRARDEAKELLSRTNREIEKTIRHIRENQAQKQETRKMRERLESFRKDVASPETKPEKKAQVNIEKGDIVRLMNKDVSGEVLSVRGNNVEVQIGALKTIVKKSMVERISRGEAKRMERKSGTIQSNVDMNQRLSGFSHTLDVRGKRFEEALSLVNKFIDDALLFSAREIRILHGKGDGILRTRIREHLKGNPYIESINDEHVERGGAGISVILLK